MSGNNSQEPAYLINSLDDLNAGGLQTIFLKTANIQPNPDKL